MARKAIKLRKYKKEKKEIRKKNETRRALISPSFILAMLLNKLHSFDDERSSSQKISYSTKKGS